ncbi:Chitotriosidase-1 [Halotydeus destructor]|nr:Chitotriosidase-1 [Halotydeus destructor]
MTRMSHLAAILVLQGSLLVHATKCPAGYSWKRDATDCGKFYHCDHGLVKQEHHCGEGLVFNEQAVVCDWPGNVKDCNVKEDKNHKKPPASSGHTGDQGAEGPHHHHEVDHGPTTKSSWDVDVWSPSIGPTTPAEPPPRGGLRDDYKVVCYFSNWAWYRPDSGRFIPEDMNPYFCTHINYAFAVLDGESLTIKIHDSWADEDNNFMKRVVGLKEKNGRLKVLLAIGGWNDSEGDKYSRLVASPASRRKFIVHALHFVAKYGFDGIDLDWEYPSCWQAECDKGNAHDRENFAQFVTELHAELKARGLLLTAAVSPSKKVIDAAYDVPVLAHKLDWINLMAYDYHGAWDKHAEHHAPLFARPESKAFDPNDQIFNVNYTVNHWMARGMPARKIVLGVPFYGRSFEMNGQAAGSHATRSGYGAPVRGGGEAGEYTRDKGYLAYYEICQLVGQQRWLKRRDPHSGPFAFNSDQWVGYDDPTALLAKTSYIKSHGLGGAMIWAIDLDDFRGQCCGVKYPLLKTLNYGLRGMHSFNIRSLQCA